MSRPQRFAGYSLPEVAKLLSLPEREIGAALDDGILEARLGADGEPRFNFTDLVVLRAAKELLAGGIGRKRVREALTGLRRRLPRGRSLASVHLSLEGGDVVVRDGGEVWEAASGQGVLDFSVSELATEAAPLSRHHVAEVRASRRELAAEEWFEVGLELETTAPDEAIFAYRKALLADLDHADSHLNLGRLLHEGEDYGAAEFHYRIALRFRPDDPTAWFNLGVALEDQGRDVEAAEAYEAALEVDQAYADAHYNLAGLCERRGDGPAALRHLKEYRALRA